MPTITYDQATMAAMQEEMRRDPRVWCLGEDLARGGVFGQYAGLVDAFGPSRIVSTPIAEAMVALTLIDHFLRDRAQNADVDRTVEPHPGIGSVAK